MKSFLELRLSALIRGKDFKHFFINGPAPDSNNFPHGILQGENYLVLEFPAFERVIVEALPVWARVLGHDK